MNRTTNKRSPDKRHSRRESLRKKLIQKANALPGVKEALEVFEASKPVQMIVTPSVTVISDAGHTNQQSDAD